MTHYILNAVYPQKDTVGPNKTNINVPVVLRSDQKLDRKDFEVIVNEVMDETGSNLFHAIDKLKEQGFERVDCTYAEAKAPEMRSAAILGHIGRNPYADERIDPNQL